jgi:hypothetical protein
MDEALCGCMGFWRCVAWTGHGRSGEGIMTWLSLLTGEAFAWLGLGLAFGWLDVAHDELVSANGAV